MASSRAGRLDKENPNQRPGITRSTDTKRALVMTTHYQHPEDVCLMFSQGRVQLTGTDTISVAKHQWSSGDFICWDFCERRAIGAWLSPGRKESVDVSWTECSSRVMREVGRTVAMLQCVLACLAIGDTRLSAGSERLCIAMGRDIMDPPSPERAREALHEKRRAACRLVMVSPNVRKAPIDYFNTTGEASAFRLRPTMPIAVRSSPFPADAPPKRLLDSLPPRFRTMAWELLQGAA